MTAVSSIISIKLVVKFTLFTEFCIKSNKQDMKMKHLLFAMAVPALVFLTACSDSGSDGDSAPKPTLSFQTGAGFTSANTKSSVDSTLKIGVIAQSNDAKLAKISISLSTNGGTSGVIFDTTITSKSTAFTYKYKVQGTVGDILKLTVKAEDANGTSAEQSLTVDIEPANFVMGVQQNQRVYNLQGPNPGAYDLTKSVNKLSSDNPQEKDIIDGTPTTTPIVFSKSWTSGNGSKFVKVTANDYTLSVTSSYVYNLWKNNAANATSTISNIAKGDVILVKSGQSVPFGIYIIKITDVINTASDNLDNILFEYRGDI
jgi:hypothetical protein